MKNIYILIIGIVLIVITLGALFYKGDKVSENQSTSNESKNILKDDTSKMNEIQEEKYYDADENINRYIVLFNSMNPDNRITADMLSVYHHHGSDHINQVMFTLESFPILITANYKNSVSINIDNVNTDNIAIKSLIKKFVKVFNSSITDEKIEQYLDSQGTGSDINTYDNIEYWTRKDGNGDKITYIKITGKLKE